MLVQGHWPGARDKPAPSACLSFGHALAVNARSRAPAAASTSAAAPPMPRETPVTRAVLLASFDMMAVSIRRYQAQLSGAAFRACTCGAAALKAKTL